jgi:hypothetical protein
LTLCVSIPSSISGKTFGQVSSRLAEWLYWERFYMVVSPASILPDSLNADSLDPQVLATYQKMSMPGLLDYASYYTIRSAPDIPLEA